VPITLKILMFVRESYTPLLKLVKLFWIFFFNKCNCIKGKTIIQKYEGIHQEIQKPVT
jgi:hypothetical protein